MNKIIEIKCMKMHEKRVLDNSTKIMRVVTGITYLFGKKDNVTSNLFVEMENNFFDDYESSGIEIR